MKNIYYALIGGVIGAVLGGGAVYIFEKRKCELNGPEDDGIQEREDRLDYRDNTIDKLVGELSNEQFKTEQLLDAINTFCNESDKENILDLVNVRLNVRAMREQGVDEETITDAMIRRRCKDLIGRCGYGPKEPATEEKGEYDEDPGLDKVEEITRRDIDPYLISEEEYVSNDGEYRQEVLTYYALDDTLADENDDIVDQDIVGEDNLLTFEEHDHPAIFVRNERLGIEYEIIWEDAVSYHAACLGVQDRDALLLQRVFR